MKASRLFLLSPHLEARAKERGFLQEAQEILKMAKGSEEPSISNTLQRKLHKVFRKMSFSGLVSSTIRYDMTQYDIT